MGNNSNGIKRFFADFKKYLPLLLNLSSKDIKLKYRRSFLGFAWSVLNPLLTMLVLTQVFGLLLKIQVPNFATYYIVGVSIWNFFSEATSGSMMSVIGAAPLIKKVYIPKYIFPLQKCLFAFINFALSLIAVIAVMLIEGVWPTFTILLAPIPILYCFIFSVGFSLMLSALTVYFRDIMHLYSVILTLWMYLTPIIYPIEIIQNAKGHMAHLVMTVIRCNPLYHYVTYFRDVMMYNTVPSLKENAVCLGLALFFLLLGAVIFKKAEKKFILHI